MPRATATARVDTPSLAKMFCTWRATVCGLIVSVAAIWRLVRPAAISWRTAHSRS